LESVLEELGLRDEPLTLRVTGCPNGCARPYVAEVALVGRSLNKYTLFLGGHPAGTRLAERFIDILPYEQVIPTLHTLLAHFQTHRHPAEPFGDFVHRVGFGALHELVIGN
jgi:sulfite reductase (ferredoxin)